MIYSGRACGSQNIVKMDTMPMATNVPAWGTFSVSRHTPTSWRKKEEQNPKLEETLLPAQTEDILEADEMWLFVQERWCNWRRQSNARFVGKTLSFSKSDTMHEIVTHLLTINRISN